MDGENNGEPYEQMDDLGVPLFLETPIFGGFQMLVFGDVVVIGNGQKHEAGGIVNHHQIIQIIP